MSGSSEEKERDDMQHAVSKPSDQTLNLFQPRGVSHPENWQCIYYIAPTNKKRIGKHPIELVFIVVSAKRP